MVNGMVKAMGTKGSGITPNQKDQAKLIKKFNDAILWAVHNFVGYITVKNASLISGYTESGARVGLRRLAKNKALIEHKVPSPSGRKISIWGITKSGRKAADLDAINDDDLIGWHIGRYRQDTLDHEMAVQFVAHKLTGIWKNVGPPKLIGGQWHNNRLSGGRRPDIMIGGYAVEIELTIKSYRRYCQIFDIYESHKTGSDWLCPPDKTARLDKILDLIEPGTEAHVYRLDIDNGNLDETEESIARQKRLDEGKAKEKAKQETKEKAEELRQIEIKKENQEAAEREEIEHELRQRQKEAKRVEQALAQRKKQRQDKIDAVYAFILKLMPAVVLYIALNAVLGYYVNKSYTGPWLTAHGYLFDITDFSAWIDWAVYGIILTTLMTLMISLIKSLNNDGWILLALFLTPIIVIFTAILVIEAPL